MDLAIEVGKLVVVLATISFYLSAAFLPRDFVLAYERPALFSKAFAVAALVGTMAILYGGLREILPWYDWLSRYFVNYPLVQLFLAAVSLFGGIFLMSSAFGYAVQASDKKSDN